MAKPVKERGIFVIVCGICRMQISKLLYRPRKPRKCYTKIKPVLNAKKSMWIRFCFSSQERDRNRGLTVMEDTRNQVYVEGLKEHTVTNAEDVFLLMEGITKSLRPGFFCLLHLIPGMKTIAGTEELLKTTF